MSNSAFMTHTKKVSIFAPQMRTENKKWSAKFTHGLVFLLAPCYVIVKILSSCTAALRIKFCMLAKGAESKINVNSL